MFLFPVLHGLFFAFDGKAADNCLLAFSSMIIFPTKACMARFNFFPSICINSVKTLFADWKSRFTPRRSMYKSQKEFTN